MNRPSTLVRALLRKDFRLFWPFAALVAILLVLSRVQAAMALLGPFGGLLQLLVPLSIMLLILVVCHEDAVVGVKHDWLTRPISGQALLIAKVAFVAACILLPLIIGGIADNLYQGNAVGEALLSGVATGASGGNLMLVVLVMALAAVTAGIRQAMIVLLSAFIGVAVVVALVIHLGPAGEALGRSGSAWLLAWPLQAMVFCAGIAIVCTQYRHRHTKAARLIVGAAFLAGLTLIIAMNPSRIFAVQEMLAPDPGAAARVQVKAASGCFPARTLEAGASPPTTGAASRITPQLFSEEQRRQGGADGIAFATQLLGERVPAGDRLILRHAALSYRAGDTSVRAVHSERTVSQWRASDAGPPALEEYWLLSRAHYAALAAKPEVVTQLDYSLSLLAPVAEGGFAANGERGFYRHIGYCSAKFDRATGVIDVDCLKLGAQPAQLVANVDGAPDADGRSSGDPDFTPAVLDFWGARRHRIQLHTAGKDIPRIRITAYRARAHFNWQVVTPGILGGPISVCPSP